MEIDVNRKSRWDDHGVLHRCHILRGYESTSSNVYFQSTSKRLTSVDLTVREILFLSLFLGTFTVGSRSTIGPIIFFLNQLEMKVPADQCRGWGMYVCISSFF